MKVFLPCITVLLLIWTPITNAAVIGSNYIDDIVAVYYFNAEANSVVQDYGINGVHGVLVDDATLAEEGQYAKCLSLAAKDDYLAAHNNEAFIGSLNVFSIVAWVKIPNQDDDFRLSAYASNPGILEPELIGTARLMVKSDGNLSALYADIKDKRSISLETTGQNVSNNTWQHIAFTISQSQMRLYLNGERIAEKDVTRYTSFLADQTTISIGSQAIGSVDDAGFFDDTFNDTHIDIIYDLGLQKIISIASVEAGNKVTTTWGSLKSQR